MPERRKDIERAKKETIDSLNAPAAKIDGAVHTILMQTIEEAFDISNLMVEDYKDFIRQLNKLTNDILDLIHTEIKFTGDLSQLIKKDPSNSGAINTKLLSTFKYDGLLITGSLIDVSSPQCRFVIEKLGGKITRENWPQVKAIAEMHGLIENTTFDNLPKNKLHKECRHEFFPIKLKT